MRRSLLLLLLFATAAAPFSGCASFANIMAGGGQMQTEGYRTWSDCVEAVSEPNPGGWPNILGGTLFLVLEAPLLFIYDTAAFLVYLWIDGGMKLIYPDHDMYLVKSWLAWWYVLFSNRKFTVTGWGARLRDKPLPVKSEGELGPGEVVPWKE
jgi:hypothetical protein